MPSEGLNLKASLSQGLRNEQVLTLSQEQRMGLELLQKNALELQQRINQELQQNPMLVEIQAPGVVYENELASVQKDGTPSPEEREYDQDAREFQGHILEESAENSAPRSELLREEDAPASSETESPPAEAGEEYVRAPETAMPWNTDSEEHRQHFLDSITREPGFLQLLLRECEESVVGDEAFTELCRKLCCAVNDAGFLLGSDEELCQLTGASVERLHQAIDALQQLDPPGICARSLQECLLLQLKRKGLVGSLEWEILSGHLEDLERNRLPKIAREMSCDLDEIQDAVARIKALNPNPGGELYSAAAPVVVPEVFVAEWPSEAQELSQGRRWRVTSNPDGVSTLALNADYLRLLQEKGLDRETGDYIRKRAYEAANFIHAMDLRRSTIEKIADQLANVMQPQFFETGKMSDLKPLTLERMADALQLAESTISRAIAGKYLQGPWGTRSFKSFFSSGYRSESGEEVSNLKIRQRIKDLVEHEDKRHPISDQDISDSLRKEGIPVARRTVAKYRELDGVPPASQRRIHG